MNANELLFDMQSNSKNISSALDTNINYNYSNKVDIFFGHGSQESIDNLTEDMSYKWTLNTNTNNTKNQLPISEDDDDEEVIFMEADARTRRLSQAEDKIIADGGTVEHILDSTNRGHSYTDSQGIDNDYQDAKYNDKNRSSLTNENIAELYATIARLNKTNDDLLIENDRLKKRNSELKKKLMKATQYRRRSSQALHDLINVTRKASEVIQKTHLQRLSKKSQNEILPLSSSFIRPNLADAAHRTIMGGITIDEKTHEQTDTEIIDNEIADAIEDDINSMIQRQISAAIQLFTEEFGVGSFSIDDQDWQTNDSYNVYAYDPQNEQAMEIMEVDGDMRFVHPSDKLNFNDHTFGKNKNTMKLFESVTSPTIPDTAIEHRNAESDIFANGYNPNLPGGGTMELMFDDESFLPVQDAYYDSDASDYTVNKVRYSKSHGDSPLLIDFFKNNDCEDGDEDDGQVMDKHMNSSRHGRVVTHAVVSKEDGQNDGEEKERNMPLKDRTVSKVNVNKNIGKGLMIVDSTQVSTRDNRNISSNVTLTLRSTNTFDMKAVSDLETRLDKLSDKCMSYMERVHTLTIVNQELCVNKVRNITYTANAINECRDVMMNLNHENQMLKQQICILNEAIVQMNRKSFSFW